MSPAMRTTDHDNDKIRTPRITRAAVPLALAGAAGTAAALGGTTGVLSAISYNHNESVLRADPPTTDLAGRRGRSSVTRAAVALVSDPRQRRRLRRDRDAFAAAFGLDDAQTRALESGDAHALASVGVDVGAVARRKNRPRGRVARGLAAFGISLTLAGSTLGFGAWGIGRTSARTQGRARAYWDPDYGDPTGGYRWDDPDYGSETGGYHSRTYSTRPLAGQPFQFSVR